MAANYVTNSLRFQMSRRLMGEERASRFLQISVYAIEKIAKVARQRQDRLGLRYDRPLDAGGRWPTPPIGVGCKKGKICPGSARGEPIVIHRPTERLGYSRSRRSLSILASAR